ncbi:hypothetical protein KP509_30G015900 [Ceratopteris richardii]|uniref:Uncharacterized protein n=1 Tax=Ceratopteris richardii TaxID=49495 RepID=A0A8T2R1Y0_CERRI|nr:hypothetical protein KP509_30G015900 [Ceratopteris richardii]
MENFLSQASVRSLASMQFALRERGFRAERRSYGSVFRGSKVNNTSQYCSFFHENRASLRCVNYSPSTSSKEQYRELEHASYGMLSARSLVTRAGFFFGPDFVLSFSDITCKCRRHPNSEYRSRWPLHAVHTMSRRGHCSSSKASFIAFESSGNLAHKTREKTSKDLAKYSDVQLSKQDVLSKSHLAGWVSSAVADPHSMDIESMLLELRKRFHRKTPENFVPALQQKFKFLMSESCTSVDKIAFVNAAILFSSPEQLQAVHNVLKDYFGSSEEASKMLLSTPSLVTKSQQHLKKMLDVMLEFQIDKASVEKNPKVLLCDPHRACNVLAILKGWGMDSAYLSKMVRRTGRFLSSSDECIQGALKFLASTRMSKKEILEMVQYRPSVFQKSANLEYKYSLCQEMGINFEVAIRYIVNHSAERIALQIKSFKDLGFPDEAIVAMVAKEPRLLAKSMKDLKVKIQYLINSRDQSLADISKYPACLCYSFEGRYIPRFRYLEQRGLLDSLSVSYILSLSNRQFREIFKVPDSII